MLEIIGYTVLIYLALTFLFWGITLTLAHQIKSLRMDIAKARLNSSIGYLKFKCDRRFGFILGKCLVSFSLLVIFLSWPWFVKECW